MQVQISEEKKIKGENKENNFEISMKETRTKLAQELTVIISNGRRKILQGNTCKSNNSISEVIFSKQM